MPYTSACPSAVTILAQPPGARRDQWLEDCQHGVAVSVNGFTVYEPLKEDVEAHAASLVDPLPKECESNLESAGS
jgi:hypothetical protein